MVGQKMLSATTTTTTMTAREESVEKSNGRKHVILLLPYKEPSVSTSNEQDAHCPMKCSELHSVGVDGGNSKAMDFLSPVVSFVCDNSSSSSSSGTSNSYSISSGSDHRQLMLGANHITTEEAIQYIPTVTNVFPYPVESSVGINSFNSLNNSSSNIHNRHQSYCRNDMNGGNGSVVVGTNEPNMVVQLMDISNSINNNNSNNNNNNNNNNLANQDHVVKIGRMLNVGNNVTGNSIGIANSGLITNINTNTALSQMTMKPFSMPETPNCVVLTHTYNSTNDSVLCARRIHDHSGWNPHLDISSSLPPPPPPMPPTSVVSSSLTIPLQTNTKLCFNDNDPFLNHIVQSMEVKREPDCFLSNNNSNNNNNNNTSYCYPNTCRDTSYVTSSCPSTTTLIHPPSTRHRMVKRCCHISEKKFLCNVCGKRYKYETNLITHAKVHTEQALDCPYCHKVWP
ncbi:hypothetical protein RFI_00807 [Reticulomyxa filosa]|uniref:C2H2-type domain-containing protein n=1 Tax=Reticulomyxa filosa TaxID=46433 RepID=X6PDS2_RETFI|nr:hypothetical protein RFI_00807 [Reticulomyxa filosa]|eukprot:ETO36253.1 hypothetical protein RFI_00807 [Reticulomyxa filosa]